MVDLEIVTEHFPAVGGARRPSTPAGCPSIATPSINQIFSLNEGCKTATSSPEDQCSCPLRSAPPPRPKNLPFPANEKNNEKMREWLVNEFASSTFNTCPHRPLPCMSGPPLRIHVDTEAKPRTCHTPATVPVHWEKSAYEGLLRDEALGVIERVPYGEPVTWCHRAVFTRKPTGIEPRRTVDLQQLNKVCKRETYPQESPFTLARRVPSDTWKSCFDAWNGYHSLPLADEDRHLTTFITPWGRWRYKKAPQGYASSGDGYVR